MRRKVSHYKVVYVLVVDHSNIHLSPSEGCQLIGWNLTEAEPMQGPAWHNRTTYFVFLVSGYEAKTPLYDKSFWVDLWVSNLIMVRCSTFGN